MDIMLNLGLTSFGMIVILMTIFSNHVESRSIFDIKIALQPKECSSFTNHRNLSIADPAVVYPPAISDKINYEYTITTPNFPKNYPTDLQCITLIKAPNYDYKIIMEAREKFELEPSKDCVSDFLEITDGPYGFSNKIGKFCNSDSMPKEIKSSGPFLWLRFYSDSSLPHNGFKIVYRFMKQSTMPKIHYCYKQTIIPDDDSFSLNTSFLQSEFRNSTKIHDNASIPVECVFDFYVNPEFNTFIRKRKFTPQKNSLACEDNFMEIYHKNTVDENIPNKKLSNYFKICQDFDFTERVFVKSYRTSIRVFTKDLYKLSEFEFTITSMKKLTEGVCPPNYSRCKLSSCVPNTSICSRDFECHLEAGVTCPNDILKNGEKKILNGTMEYTTPKQPKESEVEELRLKRIHAIVLSSITVVLILCMVVCLVITIHSKKKDRCKNRIHLAEFDNINQDSSQSKRLFYEPVGTALSNEKLNRKDYVNNSIWSKRVISDDHPMATSNRVHDSIVKLNGGVTNDSVVKTSSHKAPKLKIEKMKNSSMNKIGKYLSVPNPSKNDCTQNSINSNQFINQNQSFGIMSPSEDFQSMSSQSYSKQNSSNNRSIYQHIQRASSMGSGLRKQLLEPTKSNQYTKNIEWYCGPVIRGSSIESSARNDSSDMLNAYSAKSSTHVPGCRSLPNVNYIGLQNQVYYTKPVPISSVNNDITDSLDFSYDDNSSYKEETISVKNHYIRDNSHKQFDSKRSNDDFSSSYGFKYFCAHEPSRSKDFVEYIA